MTALCRRPPDASEEWEFVIDRDIVPLARVAPPRPDLEGGSLSQAGPEAVGRVLGRSRSNEALLASALPELRAVLGEDVELRGMVFPQTVYPIREDRSQYVCSPAQVLAAGGRRLALWVDLLGVRRTVGLDELTVFDDAVVGGRYGRLSLLGGGPEITVRYELEGRDRVENFLTMLRAVRYGANAEVMVLPPGSASGDPDAWWRTAAAAARAGVDGPVLTGAGRRWWRRRLAARRCLGALTARELVIAREDDADTRGLRTGGAELMYVSRSRLRVVGTSGDTLFLEAAGVPLALDLGGRASAQMRRRLDAGDVADHRAEHT